MRQTFDRNFESLDAVFDFVRAFLADKGIDDAVGYSMQLAVEELFTNMVKYNTGGGNPIQLGLDERNGQLHMELVDEDVDPFDPKSAGDVSVDAPIEQRTPGGLGLHLVKSIVDRVTYEYKDRRMTVTVIKNLEQ